MSDVNLTLQDNGGVYLAITETPAVVTLGQAVISGALASSVTVTNVVSVNVVTMPAINMTPAAVTTVAGTVSISNFPASSSVTIANFPSVTTVTGTVALDPASLIALENITVTVGSSVSISNLPATQTIAGTVTANVVGKSNTNDGTLYPIPVCESGNTDYLGRHIPIGFKNFDAESTLVDNDNPLPIAGTVTANVFGMDFGGNTYQIPVEVDSSGISDKFIPIGFNNDGDARQVSIAYPLPVNVNDVQSVFAIKDGDGNVFGLDRSFPINGTVGVDSLPPIVGTVTANLSSTNLNSVTIGVRGTVTANIGNSITVGSLPVQLSTTTIGGTSRLNVTLSSATTVGATIPSYGNLYGGSDGTNLRAISVDTYGRTISSVINQGFSVITRGFVTIGTDSSVIDISHIPNNAIITCDIEPTGLNTGVYKLQYVSINATNPVDITVTNSFTSTTTTNISANGSYQFRKNADYVLNYLRVKYVSGIGSIAKYTISLIADPYFALDRPISGTVTASVINSVTVGAFPQVTWTDYSGTIATAGTAITAISTTTRSYLLAQVTTGQMFLNIGATATTLNSVYFSAGQGFAWETSVPQGIVSIISSVTGTNYVLKDG